ncbi:hypothetical protein BDV41DRAFT_541038, partial [Aspergillus transmontanensis]
RIRFTGNTPPHSELSTNILLTLTSVSTMPPTLSTTDISQETLFSDTEETKCSARLVQQTPPSRLLSPRKRCRARDFYGPDTIIVIRGRTQSNATRNTVSTSNYK